MNYKWRIVRLGLQDELNSDGVLLQNSIVNVRWKRIATDTDGTTASYVGQTKLTAVDVAEGDFISLDDITEATVITWIENALSDKGINRINNTLIRKIEKSRITSQKPNW